MTPEKEKLLHLKRIADALEDMLPLLEKLANPPIVFNLPPAPDPPAVTPMPTGGYRCGICGNWVPNGNIHYCSGKNWPYTQPSPNIYQTDPDMCSSSWKGPQVMVYNGETYYHSGLLGTTRYHSEDLGGHAVS